MKHVLIIIMGLFLAGCVTPEALMKKNNESLLLLQTGMSRQQVINIMGKPTLNEAHTSKRGKSIVIYYYYTQREFADGNYTKDESTPVVFENDKLIGWGDAFRKGKNELNLNIKHRY